MNEIAKIDHFNLWSFDLNLLVAFDAIMRERSITKAAARLRLQQPAMSHNLSTLRVLFQDELFTRVGHTMVPTPRAHALAAPISGLLAQANGVLATKENFDPEHDEVTFKVGFSSELEVILMPKLAALFSRIAPNVKIMGRLANPDQVHKFLDEGVVDIAVGGYEDGSKRHKRDLMYDRQLMCCYNKNLLDIDGPIKRRAYLTLPHALVSQNDSIEGCLDRALKRANLSLNVAISAPEFLTILTAVREAPLIATLPSRIIDQYADQFDLQKCPVPLNLDIRPISMVWSAHLENEPSSVWIRSKIAELIGADSWEHPLLAANG